MKNTEQVTPVAAAVTALSTILCCVPTSFAAAMATTSVGLFVADHQGWLLAASVLMTLPMILLYFFVQRYIAEGLVTSGIK